MRTFFVPSHDHRRTPRWRHALALAAALVAGSAALVPASSPAEAAVTTTSLFQGATPSTWSDPDTVSVELGVRFSSDVPGSITGMKFFKGARNTGTHVGSLWTSDGRRLATATFSAESQSGWQSVSFSSPVPVSAGTTYVASYVAPHGGYAADNDYFVYPRVVAPLRAPAGAGVYRYGSGGFPSQTYRSSNYWVDVVFAPSSTVPVVPTAPPAPTAVQYGWQLSSDNTGLKGAGVDRNTLPVFSGTITPGMTLSRVKITNVLDLADVSGVTLDRVWLAPVGGTRALWLGANSVIKDSDVDGSSMIQGERIAIGTSTSGSYQIARTSITNVSIGTWLDGDGSGTMTDTYVHDLVSINGAHKDGFTRRAGTGALLIDRSRFDASGPMVTGAFFLQNTWGGRIAGISMKNTMVEGAGYVMTLANDGPGTSVSLDNVRVRSFAGTGGTTYGPQVVYGNLIYPVWNNVRLYDSTRLPAADGAVLNAG